MAYIREFIETCTAYGWSGGPMFKTRIVTMANGRERRNAEWAQGQHKYTLPFQNIDPEGYRDVRQMFEVCRAQTHCFLYIDPLDNTADNDLIGYGDGSDSEFQLTKVSTLDGVSYQREVYAIPDDAVISVTLNGVPTVAYTLDRDRGVLLFTAPVGLNVEIRWSGSFAVWVRFTHDWLPMSIDNRRGTEYAINGTIDLLEMPPPELVET